MTTTALIFNLTEGTPKIELQGRALNGTFKQVSETVLPENEHRPATLFRGQHALVIGPATVLIANSFYGSPEWVVKVETQEREEDGTFKGENVAKARILKHGEHWVFSVRKGEQLQLHEKAASA